MGGMESCEGVYLGCKISRGLVVELSGCFWVFGFVWLLAVGIGFCGGFWDLYFFWVCIL